MSRLESLRVSGGEWIGSERVFHVNHPHALTQAAGYLKYRFRQDGPVYFRGQSENYPSLYPSLYRDIKNTTGIRRRQHALHNLLKSARQAEVFLRGTPEYVHSPLLQHYGIRKNWLDLVDNIWITLWFACHKASGAGEHREYMYFETRKRHYHHVGKPDYVYILLIHVGDVKSISNRPGVNSGSEAEVIDLRVAALSLYLRPHAQHAILLKAHGDDYTTSDLRKLVIGTIRVELGDALAWMGAGDLLSVHTLFPPPHYDPGYRRLLEYMIDPPLALGGIHHICA